MSLNVGDRVEVAVDCWSPLVRPGDLGTVTALHDASSRHVYVAWDNGELTNTGPWAVGNLQLAHDRVCPDGGTCHHSCKMTECFRVRSCSPLSGVYPSNEWPVRVKRALGEFKC